MIGLDPAVAYSLTVTGQATAGGLRPGDAAAVRARRRRRRGRAGLGGHRRLEGVRGARGLWLLLLDDDLVDNEGDLVVSVAPSKAP
jgi:hypothetical protein